MPSRILKPGPVAEAPRRPSGERVRLAAQTLTAFRETGRASGLVEARRRGVVSRHDASIRFTNSTISVLKPHIGTATRSGWFLTQPALRLRNLDHYASTGQVSGFGCCFHAMGVLLPADDATAAVETASRLCAQFLEALPWIETERLIALGSVDDPDLTSGAAAAGWPTRQVEDDPASYRHVFGIPGTTGRNVNFWVDAPSGAVALGNVITIEQDGVLVAVELALGTATLLAARLGCHPIRTTAAADAAPHLQDLMALDALMAVAVLALEGLRPTARGRSGRYRQLVRVLLERHGGSQAQVLADVVATAELELQVRQAASPLDPEDLSPEPMLASDLSQLVDRVADDLGRVGEGAGRPADG